MAHDGRTKFSSKDWSTLTKPDSLKIFQLIATTVPRGPEQSEAGRWVQGEQCVKKLKEERGSVSRETVTGDSCPDQGRQGQLLLMPRGESGWWLVDREPYGVHLPVYSAPDSALTDSCALFSLGPRRGE